MIRAFRLMGLHIRLSIQNLTAYRFDVAVRVVMAFVHMAVELMAVWIIFRQTESIRGWNWRHMLVLVGVFRIVAGGIRIYIVPNMRALLQDIRTGKLDFALLKPVNAQFLVSIREFVVWRMADVVLGVAVAIYGCVKLTGTVPIGAALNFVITLMAAGVIVYSIWLMLATLCFWFVRIQNIEMVFWNVFEAGRYPIVIYRPWVQSMLTFVVPLAFITTIPAAALVGEDRNILAYAPLWAVGVAAVMFALAGSFWRFGLRRYSGASG
ncbi:MAG: ABC transporter permease [Phycisphaerae bacterium]